MWFCVGVYLLEERPQTAARPAGRAEPWRAAQSQRQAGRRCHLSAGGHLVEEETCHAQRLFITDSLLVM